MSDADGTNSLARCIPARKPASWPFLKAIGRSFCRAASHASSIACARCRRSKVKCMNNGVNTTCKACENAGRECTYPAPATGERVPRRESGAVRRSSADGTPLSSDVSRHVVEYDRFLTCEGSQTTREAKERCRHKLSQLLAKPATIARWLRRRPGIR